MVSAIFDEADRLKIVVSQKQSMVAAEMHFNAHKSIFFLKKKK